MRRIKTIGDLVELSKLRRSVIIPFHKPMPAAVVSNMQARLVWRWLNSKEGILLYEKEEAKNGEQAADTP